MVDASSVAGAVAATAHVASLFKGLLDSSKTVGQAELAPRLVELSGAMLDLQVKQMQLIDENAGLRARIRELADNIRVVVHYGLYWKIEENGLYSGPYDTMFWGRDQKLIRWRFQRVSTFTNTDEPCYVFEPLDGNGMNRIAVPASFMKEHGLPEYVEHPPASAME